MQKGSFLSVVLVLMISGCSKTGALITMPDPPSPERDSVRFSVVVDPLDDLEENVVQSRNYSILMGSSVVIAVPDKRVIEQEAGGDYRTSGFFHAAEQEIERSFLRNGFQVKDRSKFEAILRDLRDSRQADSPWRNRDLDDYDPAMQYPMQQLQRAFDSGAISESEYVERVRELHDQFRVGSGSRKREEGDRELTDISEVIRAAGASEIQADYVLQIHEFDTLRVREERINLFNYESVRDFMERHSNMRRDLNARQYFSCESLIATLNAKLIHVATGNVLWIGNHTVSELEEADSATELEFRYLREVSNATQVANFVERQNTPQARKARGDTIELPAWQFRQTLIGPTMVSGSSCVIDRRGNDEVVAMRRQLSRRVASELISTIEVSGN